MKYEDFYKHLSLQVQNLALIGPSISIKLSSTEPKISISKFEAPLLPPWNDRRFVIFPIKIYGETIRHLNILILDNKTKIIERYEPFNQYLNASQLDDLLELLLYKLMSKKKIYFLKFQTTLNTETVLNDKNCGLYCVKYVANKIKNSN
jgi:hypothetical protein